MEILYHHTKLWVMYVSSLNLILLHMWWRTGGFGGGGGRWLQYSHTISYRGDVEYHSTGCTKTGFNNHGFSLEVGYTSLKYRPWNRVNFPQNPCSFTINYSCSEFTLSLSHRQTRVRDLWNPLFLTRQVMSFCNSLEQVTFLGTCLEAHIYNHFYATCCFLESKLHLPLLRQRIYDLHFFVL